MPKYHVRVIPERGTATLYMTKQYREIHDGPFSESPTSRQLWETPEGPARRIEKELLRQPNRRYGTVSFEVIEEADPIQCRHCGKIIVRDGRDWIDPEGNDCCPFGFVPVPHEPADTH